MPSTTSGRYGRSEPAPTGPGAGPPTEPRAVDGDRFRALMSSFPSGVAVLTTVGADGLPRGLTCTSVCSVGLRPPSLLVCLDQRSGTLHALRESGTFAVNLLHARGRGAAETFAAPDPDRFARVAWEPAGPHALPRLTEDAHTLAECRVLSTVPAGDHTVVIGAVEEVSRAETGAAPGPHPAPPLLYGERRYAEWPCPAAPEH